MYGSRSVRLPLLFFVCLLVIASLIPSASAGEPAGSTLSRAPDELNDLPVFSSVALAPSLHLPVITPSCLMTGSPEAYAGSCSNAGCGFVPEFSARQPAERVTSPTTGTSAVPFSVIDTRLPPADASALKARIQETLYAFTYDEAAGSWYARNPANRVTLTYTQVNGTAAFFGSGSRFGLTLAGLGRNDTFAPAGRGVATASGRELTIARPGYTEWYRNNDDGIEQGMTLASRPPGTGPLQVRFGLAGNATRSGTDGTALTITGASGEPLFTYAGLHAFSADGAVLPVSLTTDGMSVTWVVDDTLAVYPVTIDPVVAASAADARFTGGATSDYFGYSVALSSDGTTALVGAYYNDTADNNAGAAYIFEKGGGWSSRSASAADARFTGGAADDNFGDSVALSSDGSTALVGAHLNSTGVVQYGAAYIFVKPGGGWSSRSASAADARFTGGAHGDYFGSAVALSSDGTTALVGAYYNDTAGADAGAAYIFEKGGGWTSKTASAATARFTGGFDGDYFGWSIALPSDGSTALVGAYGNDTAGTNAGAAYIFGKGGGWSSKSASAADARFTGGDAGDWFGSSVALSSDASTALVGAYGNDTAGGEAGAAYIFVKPGGGWSSRSASAADARFTGGAANDYFGNAVALSSDASTALVGAYHNRSSTEDGSAYLFWKGGGWSSKSASAADTQFTAGATSDNFGNAVALSSDGSTALVGAWYNDTAGDEAGAAYIFLVATAPTVTGISPTSGTTAGGTSVTVTGTGFTGATAVKFGATNAASYTVNSATQITAVSPAGSTGTVDITVTTSAGTSATGAADRFTYSSPTPTPTPTAAPAGNGGSDYTPGSQGSSGSPAVSTATNIVAGQPATFSFDQNPTATSPVALNDVQVVFSQNQGSVEMIGGAVSYGGSIPGQTVVGVITIELVGLNPNLVNGATISFSVNGQYLRDHHIDPAQVTLMRNHDGQWSPLESSLVGQTGDTYHYEALTPGFSRFAVVVSHAGIAANTTVVTTPVAETTPPDQGVIPAPALVPATRPVIVSPVTSVPLTTATTAVPAAPVPNPGIPAIAIAGIVALGAAIGGAFLVRRWWIRRQNPALFEEM